MTETQESTKAERALKVREIIARVLCLPLGDVIDSMPFGKAAPEMTLDAMTLILMMLQNLGLKRFWLSFNEIFNCVTVADVIELIESKMECES